MPRPRPRRCCHRSRRFHGHARRQQQQQKEWDHAQARTTQRAPRPRRPRVMVVVVVGAKPQAFHAASKGRHAGVAVASCDAQLGCGSRCRDCIKALLCRCPTRPKLDRRPRLIMITSRDGQLAAGTTAASPQWSRGCVSMGGTRRSQLGGCAAAAAAGGVRAGTPPLATACAVCSVPCWHELQFAQATRPEGLYAHPVPTCTSCPAGC